MTQMQKQIEERMKAYWYDQKIDIHPLWSELRIAQSTIDKLCEMVLDLEYKIKCLEARK